MNKDTKSNHPSPSEDSLLRELKKEIIKLKSLNRRAAEEIRDLDDMIIKSIEENMSYRTPHRKFRRRRKIGSKKRKLRRKKK